MSFIHFDHFNFSRKNKHVGFCFVNYLFSCRISYFFILNISLTSSANSDQLGSSLIIDKRSGFDDREFSLSDSDVSLSITA